MKKNNQINNEITDYYEKLLDSEDTETIGNFARISCFRNKEWFKEEKKRVKKMFSTEKKLINKITVIAGVDEVGRGPMAGPVVACAVNFSEYIFLPGLDDSKKVEPQLRNLIARAIQKYANVCSVASVSAEEIDRINIHNASLKAMKLAVILSSVKPGLLLVDGNHRIRDLDCPQKTVVKGDGKYYSIASASIVAKTARDNLMRDLGRLYPGYSFENHKGYCTPGHIKAIEELGPCPVHRRSYGPIKKYFQRYEQLTLIK
ncbi:MAG: ribonuclease HII [Vulcanimicrobiota bacterium]